MSDIEQPNAIQRTFVESSSAVELRTKRVWRFVNVMWMTWLFFSCYLVSRDYAAANICVVIACSIAIFNLLTRSHCPPFRIMNVNLIFSAIGLFSVAISDEALHNTILFYPVAILVASQLFGTKPALLWTIVNCVAFLLFNFVIHGFVESFYRPAVDQLTLQLGIALCTFFCCQQGEEYYRKRTSALVQFSEDLNAERNRLEKMSITDGLTGLTNRFQFQLLLRQAIAKSSFSGERTILYMIDMNGFKEINDTMGHLVGDEALIHIGNRLLTEFGNRFQVARLGGDEFCIIAGSNLSDEDAEGVAKRICQLLSYRYKHGENEFPLTASVGYCIYPDHADNDKDVFAYADTAMYFAKENRSGFACYDKSMTERLVEHRLLQDKLSTALAKNEFYLVYQPQVDISSGKITGVEALLRWRSEGAIIPPNRFIPVLERGGEIRTVGKWIIREACRQWAEWNAQGLTTKISINVSAVQFQDSEFIEAIENSIAEFNVAPSDLDFEITEGLLIADVEEAINKLKEIKKIGSSVSVDDFGTGYSSLSYLRHFPIDRLKIDRAFVKDYPVLDDGVIASSIIVLAKSLGLRVLAEGVEHQEQLDFLKEQECNEYQGFFFSRPISPEEVGELLRADSIADPPTKSAKGQDGKPNNSSANEISTNS